MHHNQLLNGIVCLSVIFLLCTFNIDNKDPLIMTRVGDFTDTVSIWPKLTFMFSIPLKDSSVNILIIPDPGPVYDNYLNKTKDTLEINVTGTLEGSTQYKITLKDVLTAENGSKLYPDNALFEIITRPKEKEPNSGIEAADTLSVICFGMISPANDTDYFYIYNTTATGLYLKNHEGKSGFVIKDTSGGEIAADGSLEDIKTFMLSDIITMPIFIGIFSLVGNNARYELGLVL